MALFYYTKFSCECSIEHLSIVALIKPFFKMFGTYPTEFYVFINCVVKICNESLLISPS